jgi:phospholipid/cholesterol/gamma-HCH transport system substrate-binding protein
MKPFRERNAVIVGGIGVIVLAGIAAGAYKFTTLASYVTDDTYTAYFEEAGGLTVGAAVQVSGYQAGQVRDIELRPEGVLVTFSVDNDIRLGESTEASIHTKSVLGNKVVDIAPRGGGQLGNEAIPLDRTKSPYQLPDAIGELTSTISGLDTRQLSDSLSELSATLKDTPPQVRLAVDGVARLSRTINQRDEQLRELLADARKTTGVLAERTDEIVRLIHDTNSLLATLRTQSAALDTISGNISALAQQIHGFIDDNSSTLTPTLDKLNGVLTILDNRKAEIQESIKGLGTYAMSLGETLASGPFFKAYLANLLPGQFIQPFVDAAFSDLGLDPNVLSPTERVDPPTGQPGTPALPIPYPRTGQGGEPNLTLPDAITGKPGDPRYPYREPLPAPPPGGPPPGPPAQVPGQGQTDVIPEPVFVPAPGEPPAPGAPEPVGENP